ncbi:TIGR01777 family oxidoreductase [Leptospira sp. 2 VSF19]|uniref:TIGR01777 family oxidoreductase n=1 Tax=Leptospira soteropolitanensis TaxID=2950025 RepID=A0AAW5VE76_9LEPT|nr:TIGR01777 family oxidoreductase [Leptospira soteropolitanensis]MCW7493478.1 TIGR01777 family oxidoreductase [Leptospira soteropolitanensis]MCW7500990.1 TIGR01777 family oxidoreductase [Leptospira soteropolitanensis]MCW7523330.1 TIGR01777 family oxidoreductase [Leptospira soteropolitanensis]MCW7527191.1 TIGR01777 family oxidoreductase [Leptospira soteropolitanensis]MCW7531048.1 TIGR01777 family oxidoreductase [Leptospira soteropolitanensis]
MKIGILGGTGLIGKSFIKTAIGKGHRFRVFSRQTSLPDELSSFKELEFVSCILPQTADLEGLDAIVNLVGEPIAGVRWTEERKRLIRTSRVDFTRGVVARVLDLKSPPKVFVNSSAVGYYGMSEDHHPPYSENSAPGQDFLAKICVDWEHQTLPLQSAGIRSLMLRTGIVLSPQGGALEKMIPPFLLGVGGSIASGKQGMSWIHISDFISAMLHLMQLDSASGAYNLVSPHPVSNDEFSRSLAEILHRPNFFKVPSFAIQALYGDGSVVVTKGQYVIPERLLSSGYEFQFQNLEKALANLLEKQ